jgi:hypothetical protein
LVIVKYEYEYEIISIQDSSRQTRRMVHPLNASKCLAG